MRKKMPMERVTRETTGSGRDQNVVGGRSKKKEVSERGKVWKPEGITKVLLDHDDNDDEWWSASFRLP